MVGLEHLLNEGFTKRQAVLFLNLMEQENNNTYYNHEYVQWAHANGFLADSAYAYGLTPVNISEYLSDYEFYRLWPINNWTRVWINDKLTLKYLLSNTEYDYFMPKYYFYSLDKLKGVEVRRLVDCPDYLEQNEDGIIQLLIDVGDLACKPCNGSLSMGFFKLSYRNNNFFINDEICERVDIVSFINHHANYLFIEYLYPSAQFKRIFPVIHTLRVVVINKDGINPKIVGGYLRFPNKTSGIANYTIVSGEHINDYNIVLDVNFETGKIGNARLTYATQVKPTKFHPDTKAILDNVIDDIDGLKKIILGIAKRFNTIEFMGFDVGITENGFKCMEINSHSGIKYMQIFNPFLKDDYLRRYFLEKIEEINTLTVIEKRNRNMILR
jgi:hypothetical protein